jgi:hypothetical protein
VLSGNQPQAGTELSAILELVAPTHIGQSSGILERNFFTICRLFFLYFAYQRGTCSTKVSVFLHSQKHPDSFTTNSSASKGFE